MPFASVADLPDRIKARYGAKAQRAFLGAFNSAYGGLCSGRSDRDGCAFAVGTKAAQGVEKNMDTWGRSVDFYKADDERQIVYGIVLEPNVEDSQGDIVPPEEVEKAAHNFAIRYAQGKAEIGLDHETLINREGAPLVETYVAPVDFQHGDQVVKAGSWIIAVHIPDAEVWKSIKAGGRTGYSIKGRGTREQAA